MLKQRIFGPYSDSSLLEYDLIRSLFESNEAWGLLTSLDLSHCDPDIIRSSSQLKDYVIKLCEIIDMKRFGEPMIVHFGQEERVAGYSLLQLIETSSISGHFVNETNSAYIDIFSCKLYNPHDACQFTQKYFSAQKVVMSVLLRK